MRDYKTNNYYRNDTGYKSSPELVLLAIIFASIVAELSWYEIYKFFGF